MRGIWQKIDRFYGNRIGLTKYPKQMNSVAIRNMIYEGWKIQGIREKLDTGKRRHEFKSTHCLRYLKQNARKAKLNHNNIKIISSPAVPLHRVSLSGQ